MYTSKFKLLLLQMKTKMLFVLEIYVIVIYNYRIFPLVVN